MRKHPDYPMYSVTEDGKIYSKYVDRFLKPIRDRYGYLYVVLTKDKKHKHKFIHKAVLETFIGPCPEGMECRHLDGNQRNNKLTNLVWGTHAENHQDKIKHGTILKGEKNTFAKLTEEQVNAIKDLLTLPTWNQSKIARIFNVTPACIGLIQREKS